ncbi:glycosyltransferase family 2 protein [bacterium]|nr:glycosyltransferase family 2 protein [bacterium]
MKKIEIVLPCYNEEGNIHALYERLCVVVAELPQYSFSFLFVDNDSEDGTVAVIRGLSKKDDRVRAIVNARNFGFVRSPFHGLLQAEGDAAVLMATDLQDPPELLEDLAREWERGFAVVLGQKIASKESRFMFGLRSIFYHLVARFSEIPLLKHVTGFGLYDRTALEIFRQLNDPYPYTRGLVTEVGLPHTTVSFQQAARKRGFTKFNFLGLYDLAMLAFTSYARLPIRLATISGFLMSIAALVLACVFTVCKVLFWDEFPAGYASIFVSILFFASVQIFLLGFACEYIFAILTHVKSRPHVIERERIGF